ncbi:MAG TPA: response regulator [Gammaproteobacteria bacterium]|jgi:CheY-like chemotaxis protein|nr:response regulator [Gammaproteobacteria bacterium]
MSEITRTTILLAEDDQNDVMLIKRAFSKSHVINPIACVENGEEAVAYLAGQGEYVDRERYPLPFMMLLDLKLPRLSGHEVLKWLREQPGLKRLPVVVLTSSREPSDINRAYETGANSYLVKPVVFEEFSTLLKQLQVYWLMLSEHPELS